MRQDRTTVIDKATNLFWEKGFHATSMRSIQEVIDMRPGSIYACFGSKEGLYRETLKYYGSSSLSLIRRYRQEFDSPLNALEAFTRFVVKGSSEEPCNMCMLVKSVSELTEENQELLEEARGLLKVIEMEFSAILNEARVNGELSDSKDPSRLAKWFQMQLMGLRTYFRTNSGDKVIDEMIDDIFLFLKS